MSTSRASIEVTPTVGLIDEPLSVRLHGLQPGTRVTITSRTTFGSPTGAWSTSAQFEADSDGNVDVDQQSPVSGAFAEADASAFIWSLRPEEPGSASRSRGEDLAPYDLTFTVEGDGITLKQTITRRVVAPDVKIIEIREPAIKANLFLPDGPGPFPTVLVLGGSGGGYSDSQAALLASHGFAAISLAYFGVEDLPSELRQIPLEYFEGALAWIADHPLLQSDRLAVSGTSRGGELALLLASRYPQLRSVVAWVPSGYVWGAVSKIEETGSEDDFASWTYGGKAIPHAGRVRNDDVAPDSDGVVRLTPAFFRYIADTAHSDPALIRVEQINGPVLLVSAKDDALWPSAAFSELIVERLQSTGFDFPVEHLSYDGAGHSIGAGYAPTTINQGFHPVREITIDRGGTPAALARARADAWPRVLDFLRANTTTNRLVSNDVSPVAG
jgi:dienelactone hydrolase